MCNSEMSDSCQVPQQGGGLCGASSDCVAPIECAFNVCGGSGASCASNNDTLCDTLAHLVCNGVSDQCESRQPVGGYCLDDNDCVANVGYVFLDCIMSTDCQGTCQSTAFLQVWI